MCAPRNLFSVKHLHGHIAMNGAALRETELVCSAVRQKLYLASICEQDLGDE